MGDTLQEVMYVVFKIFLIVVLVAFGVYFMQETPLKDVTKAYLEVACTKGGFTSTDIQNMKDELSKSGYDSSELAITITPNSAINISSTNYVKRGEIISLNIIYNKSPIIDSIFKKLGSTNTTKNSCIRYGMSEKP